MTTQSTSTLPLALRYNKAIGIAFIALGGINLFLGLWLLLLGSFTTSLFIGIGMFCLGLTFLTRTYATVYKNRIVFGSGFLGIQGKTYNFSDFGALEIHAGKLCVNQDGATVKRVPIAAWIVRREDWRQLETLIREHLTVRTTPHKNVQ